VIDRFQLQIHSQRWPTDFHNNIDMVLQPVSLGAGEITFDQLMTSFKWLLGSEPRSAGDVHLMGIFSDPSTEVRDWRSVAVAAAGEGRQGYGLLLFCNCRAACSSHSACGCFCISLRSL
jgi:hypothetical protein